MSLALSRYLTKIAFALMLSSIGLMLIFSLTASLAHAKVNASDANTVVISDSDDACWDGPVEIRGTVSMRKGCTATGPVVIRQSGVTLDCKNNTIDLQKKAAPGISIDSYGKELADVVVKNCKITNSKFQGIYVGWREKDRKKREMYPNAEQLYAITPHNVQLTNMELTNLGSSGIYIDDYVRNVVMDNVTILNTPAMAMYFEFNSQNTVLKNSRIEGSGRGDKREAIAIDSSSNNVIENTKFINNPYGAIHIYKNCSEHFFTNKNQVQRTMSADNNTIKNNLFQGGTVGVWIASRQSRNLKNAECGSGYYADGMYTLDSAKHNSIVGNTFDGTDIGVKVEDDSNTISSNKFKNISKLAIRVGTPVRSKVLADPVKNTAIKDNQFDSSSKSVRYMWGSKKGDE